MFILGKNGTGLSPCVEGVWIYNTGLINFYFYCLNFSIKQCWLWEIKPNKIWYLQNIHALFKMNVDWEREIKIKILKEKNAVLKSFRTIELIILYAGYTYWISICNDKGDVAWIV